MMMHHDMGGMPASQGAPDGVVRRVIFLRVESVRSTNTRAVLFGINTTRVPQSFADVDIHNLILLDIHPLGPGTEWGRVPTPMF